VRVEVDVRANGQIASTRVVTEQPLDEGFGGAARACAGRLRFAPAQTSQGTPVEGHAQLLLSFDRG
jgi:outer membrane biosynthesis protein TonB